MGQDFQFFDIVFFALVAGFIVLRLRRVLGTKTGHEKPPEDAMQRRGLHNGEQRDDRDDNVVQLPGADRAPPFAGRRDADIAPAGSELAKALTAIQAADPQFDPHGFVEGSMQAYEMIVVAFANGDADALRPLLSDEVYSNFTSVIDQRANDNQTMETKLMRMSETRITNAELNGDVAEITVKFEVELVSCVKDADGGVIQGHPTVPQEVAELWTFSRDTTSSNPNWILIGTEPAE